MSKREGGRSAYVRICKWGERCVNSPRVFCIVCTGSAYACACICMYMHVGAMYRVYVCLSMHVLHGMCGMDVISLSHSAMSGKPPHWGETRSRLEKFGIHVHVH